MDFGISEKAEALRQEVRQFLKSDPKWMAEVQEEVESGIGFGPRSWEFLRRVGAKGWLTPHWPKEYGGLGASYIERYLIFEEFAYFMAPIIIAGPNIAGPAILLYGNDEQKKEFLPKIARGEIEFALGYTEPDAGSDLASLKISAAKNGDYYIINGQKVFNTAGHYAQYHWLGARTDTTGPLHKGISLFIVDLNSPGITVRPLIGMGGMRTNEIFYDNVKVPKDRLVGQENRGWYYIATALDLERIWLVGDTIYWFEQLVKYVEETKHNGKPLIEEPVLRQRIGELATEIEVVRLFGMRVACMADKKTVPNYESAMGKAYGGEVQLRVANTWLQVLGMRGRVETGTAEDIRLTKRIQRWYFLTLRQLLVRGTSEIMRNIIAQRGLGLPRQ